MPEAQKMASEKRLIDANELSISIFSTKCCLPTNGAGEWTIGYRNGLEAVLEQIGETPTVDAVEVVRCKKCRFSKYFEESGTRKCRTQNGMYRTVEDSDFCSYGERKDNETLQELP